MTFDRKQQITTLLEKLFAARRTLLDEDRVFAQTYVQEQSTRAALGEGSDAIADAINFLISLQERKTDK